MLDPYKVLKISRDAPDEVIRAAYKALASKYHPDKNPGNSAFARIMQHINDAYALLSDPARRSEYDRISMADKNSRPVAQPSSGGNKVTIYCRNCSCALRVAEEVRSAPERFSVTCPDCRQDPFKEPARRPQSPADSSKLIINCKHCGQSIRVLAAAIHQPDRFDVNCPKCNLNPIPTSEEYKYTQSPKPNNWTGRTSSTTLHKSTTSNFLLAFRNFIGLLFYALVNFIKIAFFAGIIVGGLVNLVEYFSKSDSSSSEKPVSTSKTTTPQSAPEFSQPVQPLPETGDNTASFTNGVAPLSIKTSPGGHHHYFVKIVNIATGQELGSFFIRSGGILDIQVPVGTYEIKYAAGRQWYGAAYLFGPETTYSKADSTFNFSFDGYQYSGYTVELIMQRNGNLRTSGIHPSQW